MRVLLHVLVGLVATAMLAAPPPLTASGQTPETVARFYTRTAKDASLNEVLELAPDFDLLFGVPPTHVAQLKARKPGVAVLFYELPGGRFKGEDDFGVVNQHEEWFVHSADGQRIQNENRAVLLDIGNPEYRAYEVDYIVKNVGSAPFDGVYLDVVHPQWVQGNKEWTPPIPSRVVTAWASNMTTFLEALRAKLPASKRLFWNSLRLREEGGRQWGAWDQKALQLADGAQMDGFCFNRRNPYPEGDFAYQLQRAREVASQGKTVLLKAAVKERGSDVPQLEAFCFAAYLLVADGRNILYYPAHELNRGGLRGVPIYGARLGPASAGFVRKGSVFQRSFGLGAVIVNPTGSPAPVDVGGPMISVVDGRSVTTATVAPYSALILKKP